MDDLKYSTVFDHAPVESEFCRWVSHLGGEDPYSIQGAIGLFDVLRAHFLIVDYFYGRDSGLGGIGPRDKNLLHSALYRPHVSLGGVPKWITDYEKAATLIFGIITDHPFHDANKRTGLLLLLLFLRNINRVPTIGQHDLEDFAVEIADHKLDRYPRYRDLCRTESEPDVLFIADYLKRNSRKLDKGYYTITFRELDQRLRSFGYKLSNPSGNYIDIVRIQERRKLFGFGSKEKIDVKVAQIGFPGWKSQVTQSAVSTARKAARLTAEDGFDSQTFYRGIDPVQSLIAEYAGPLERLAHR